MKNPPPIEVAAPSPVASASEQAGQSQRSLFGEILDWMLAPFLILWPLSMALEYYTAAAIANAAYDRELRARVEVLASQLRYDEGRLSVDLPVASIGLLRADANTAGARASNRPFDPEEAQAAFQVFFQVRGLRDEIVAGDSVLPTIEFTSDVLPGMVYFRSHEVRGITLRAAYKFAQVPGLIGAVLVQVAETESKRTELASEISTRVFAVQFILVPVALLLVWFGLSQGIAPIHRLGAKIRGRRPLDLSPIDTSDVPSELNPLMHSINDLMARLSATTHAQRRFIADAAHQMRTPLAGLRTQAELALRQTGRDEIDHSLRQMAVSVGRASRLVNQLLALARAESGVIQGLQPVDLNELVREATLAWVPRAMERKIDLGFEPNEGLAFAEGHAPLLRELLNNLIDNALRYTHEGGRVTCRVTGADPLSIEVEDTGIGIEPRERPFVFDRFYRVLGTGEEGSGLGLSIAREIAEAHHGSVEVRPNPRERGSIFRCSLPPAPSARVARTSTALPS